eukprot:7330626-Pyramimonas_sp.AAC.1
MGPQAPLGPPGGPSGQKARIFGSCSLSWASFGAALPCWAPLGPSWGVIRPSWGPLEASWSV